MGGFRVAYFTYENMSTLTDTLQRWLGDTLVLQHTGDAFKSPTCENISSLTYTLQQWLGDTLVLQHTGDAFKSPTCENISSLTYTLQQWLGDTLVLHRTGTFKSATPNGLLFGGVPSNSTDAATKFPLSWDHGSKGINPRVSHLNLSLWLSELFRFLFFCSFSFWFSNYFYTRWLVLFPYFVRLCYLEVSEPRSHILKLTVIATPLFLSDYATTCWSSNSTHIPKAKVSRIANRAQGFDHNVTTERNTLIMDLSHSHQKNESTEWFLRRQLTLWFMQRSPTISGDLSSYSHAMPDHVITRSALLSRHSCPQPNNLVPHPSASSTIPSLQFTIRNKLLKRHKLPLYLAPSSSPFPDFRLVRTLGRGHVNCCTTHAVQHLPNIAP